MKAASLLTAIFTCAPALLAAQQQSTAAATSASASAQASINVPASYSAESRTKIEAAFQAAREKNLPDEPMRQRIAEGQTKNATEAQVVEAVQQTQTRLEASQAILIRAGRAKPQPAEIASGEQAIARGATEAQIDAAVKAAPADQSVVATLDGLVKAPANGSAAGKAPDGSPDATASAGVNAAATAGKGAAAGVTGAAKGAVSGVLPPKKP